MQSLNWNQVTSWRLSQHYLLERADRAHLLDVVSRLGGVHAQLMSAAELQLWARVDSLTPDDVQTALWQDRALVKTWMLRGTLHLLTAADFPLYIGALSTLRHYRRASWQKYFGVSLDELEAIHEALRKVLSDTGITREQLADEIATHTKLPRLREHLRSGWGMLLKPAAFQGLLSFGPSEGQNVTFVQPRRWIGQWTPVAPEAALPEASRRFLSTYGPATADEFARWFGFELSDAKRIFRTLGDEIAEVEVEGWKALALASSLEPMSKQKPASSVRLLPHFDPYTIAVARHSQYLMPEAHKSRVYRPQGWISPVVLVNGSIAGVWEQDKKRGQTAISVEMFAPPDSHVRQGIEGEAARLGAFLGIDAQVSFA